MPTINHPTNSADIEAATILYALVKEATPPTRPPDSSGSSSISNVIQIQVEKDTWHAATLWFEDINLSPFPPPPTPPPDAPDTQEITPNALDFLCAKLHDAYEQAAQENGWPTNPDSQTDWLQLPTANRNTMRAALAAMLVHLGITVTPQPTDPRALPAHNQ